MRNLTLVLAGALSLCGFPFTLAAQEAPPAQYRQGFWIGFGFGPGHAQIDCRRCGAMAANDPWQGGTGPSLYLAMGGTPRPNLLVGGEVNVHGRIRDGGIPSANGSSVQDREAHLGSVGVILQYYPLAELPFFLKAGAGIGSYTLVDRMRFIALSREISHENMLQNTGLGLQLGGGYDVLLTRRFALVPFANVVQVIAGGVEGTREIETVIGPSNPRYVQLGLGFHWY